MKEAFEKDSSKWFESWFDSKYYHILYKHRTYDEAQAFIEEISEHLAIEKDKKILDLACGKGRHSIHLNKLNYEVTGVDLSEESILHARTFENEKLEFYTHDMRLAFRINYFDYIFNLFTSFGYFDNAKDDLNVFKSVVKGLKKNGVFLFDFLNAKKVINSLVKSETKTIDGITFEISRKVEDGFIKKEIKFTDLGQDYFFTEKVKALTKEDIVDLMKRAGLEPKEIFGNYNLDSYSENESPRLLIIATNGGN